MKRVFFDTIASISHLKSIRVLMPIVFIYLLLMSLEIPIVLRTGLGSLSGEGSNRLNSLATRPLHSEEEQQLAMKEESDRPSKLRLRISASLAAEQGRRRSERRMGEPIILSSLSFNELNELTVFDSNSGFSELHREAWRAWSAGKKLWEDLQSGKKIHLESTGNQTELCPDSITLSGPEFQNRSRLMVIPCGLTLGSHIALVGRPHAARREHDPKISLLREGDEYVMVSQFIIELQGLKAVDGEEPPKIIHFNPRLKGDWSGLPVIEQNTCYRMQWGSSLRCEGWKSRSDEETVDGQAKCEKWIRRDGNDGDHSEESNAMWWLSRLIGRKKEVKLDWPYPFSEKKLFVLTLSAGLEGYHINVDGRHVASFPYRTGFVLEDATGLYVTGDIDVDSIVAASLPTTHPSFGPQMQLEMVLKWKAPPVPHGPVDVFVGVLSAGNHFAERMAARKSWMQHEAIKSSRVVARFFVALHPRKEVNVELKEEAEYFGDLVIVPYVDNYDLVVLKTAAICEYGVHAVSAKYVMKCDDDTFVRIDAVLKEIRKVQGNANAANMYMGNMNYYHKPLRDGKWAVTYEEWPEEDYPPYANGPGYVISLEIARFIVSEFEAHKLRVFKMEDVSMGMWIEQFNSTRRVEYVHSVRFCQFGCIEDYVTAHYQSPRQMICMWDKLQRSGKAQCCNMR